MRTGKVFFAGVVAAAGLVAASAQVPAAGAPAAAPPLHLADIPKATGKPRLLFNGRDLAGWTAWLGYPDPAVTYRKEPGAAPIGRIPANSGNFGVRTIDGGPALWVKGETWGSLVNALDLRDYHLRLEYRWGAGRWRPRADRPPNNGLLYHTHGTAGTVFGTWQPAIEFEIMKGSTGMAVMVGPEVRATVATVDDPSIIAPRLRFRPGGRPVELVNPGTQWNAEGARDAEKPEGEWNVLDLYVLGDRAVHVVNGVPVMVLDGLSTQAPDGTRRPLTHGRIQLQSEGAETFFRNITVEPIRTLPRVVAAEQP